MRRIIVVGIFMINLLLSGAASASHDSTGVVTGLVALDGLGPMMNGTVLFYSELTGPAPQSAAAWRLPTYSFRIDENGRFEAHLPEGRYTMGAIERTILKDAAPPAAEEHFFVKRDEQGMAQMVTVKQGGRTELGLVLGAP